VYLNIYTDAVLALVCDIAEAHWYAKKLSRHVMFDLQDQQHLEHINEHSSGNFAFEEESFLNFQFPGEWRYGLSR
jgi:hypothetical protein